MYFYRGSAPILISMPHVVRAIPKEIALTFTFEAMQLSGVDWHLEMLYEMSKEYDISVISAEYERCIYMEENPPYKYDASLASKLKSLLCQLLETCLSWAIDHKNYNLPSNPI